MSADYARRIVARVSGRPLIAAPPLVAPRRTAEPALGDRGDPFEAGPTAEASPAPVWVSPPRITPHRDPTAQQDAEALPAHLPRPVPASPVIAPSDAERSRPPRSPIAEEVPTRSIVEHRRIIERIVERHEDSAAVDSSDHERAAGPRTIDPAPSIGHDAPSPRRGDAQSEKPRRGDAEESRRALRRTDHPIVAAPRRAVWRAPDSHVPRQPASRPENPAPLRLRATPQHAQPALRAREFSRLVIGRLVVEIVQPPAAAAPRVVMRPAPSPRPFRADGALSLSVGRPSGLGQG
jgi:hypothetical protein